MIIHEEENNIDNTKQQLIEVQKMIVKIKMTKIYIHIGINYILEIKKEK